MRDFIAHVKQDAQGQWHIQRLTDHLRGTAELCRQFTASFSMGDVGHLIGLVHDLGKYKQAFQARIKGKSGYDPEAHVSKVDHATAGGLWVHKHFGMQIGELAAFPVITHHTGLQNLPDMERRLSEKGDEATSLEEVEHAMDDVIRQEAESIHIDETAFRRYGSNIALFIRMLFSALCDADSLDTEAFMNPDRVHLRRVDHSGRMENLYEHLLHHIETMERSAPQTRVNALRRKIRTDALKKAELEPGFFSLTVPTGGGKTLTSLAFALKHASTHGKRRIIYSIPFTSIIEQTADVFRRALGEEGADSILEHHSSIEPEKENARSLLLAENWAAPIVVTTNVQFYESLFANKRSKARKIHNIVNSVIVLDECQTIPPDFVNPILELLKELVRNYGVSVIFCSATPIPFHPVSTPSLVFEGVPGIREITSNTESLFDELKRFELHLPTDWSKTSSFESLATEINAERQVLTIVNRKSDAQELFAHLQPPKVHLSTNMCPAHRQESLNQVRERLQNNEPIRVVSTQLIEAGVDIDFPVVYRAMSGLDSIMQAGGRCNREGLMPSPGKVIVFQPPRPSPKGYLRTTEEVGRQVLQDMEESLGPSQIREYFQRLFWRRGGPDGGQLDSRNIQNKSRSLQFRDVADAMRIIDEDTVSILVPFGPGKELRNSLIKMRMYDIDRSVTNQLQRYSVSVPISTFHELRNMGYVQTLHGMIHVLVIDDLYSNETGLLIHGLGEHVPTDLIV